MLQRELVFHEEAAGCGGDAQGQDASLLVGEGGWDARGHVGSKDGVLLEAALGWFVAALVHADGVADDAVAGFELGWVDGLADLDDLAGDVAAEDDGVFEVAE